MGKRDPRVDAYIEKSAAFARPVLMHIRDVVHAACRDVEETMKWSFPHFDYKGMMCSMAAFKSHCTLGFWKPELVLGEEGKEGGMGQFGRITSVKDLPSKKVLAGYVKKAMALNDAGVKPARTVRAQKARKAKKPEAAVPEDLAAALRKNRKARTTFEGFSPSHRREYIEWITGAKRAETRGRRIATTLEWLEEGKHQNWRYEE
jgi:uncharacterized protein YdeI (YjbR/CyaY-like superfamily)